MSVKKKQKEKSPEELLQEALVPEEEQPYKVPENWVWTKLGYIFEICMGQSPKGDSITNNTKDIPLVGGPTDMGNILPKVSRYTNQPTKISRPNDLIVSIRATLGKTNFSDKEYCLGRGVASLSSDNLSIELLNFYFKLIRDYLQEISSGTTFSQISRNDIGKIYYPLPPLPEQKRIVARVESLLDKINEAKQLVAGARESFADRRAAILAKAFQGELTKKWREQNPDLEPADKLLERIKEEKAKQEQGKKRKRNQEEFPPIEPPYELPEGWCWVRLGDVMVNSIYGTSTKTDDDKEGIPVLRMGNIKDGEIILDNLKYLPASHKDVQNLKLEPGDLLFNRTNSYELVGKTAVAKPEHKGMTFASYLIRIRLPIKELLSDYICYYINSDQGRRYLLSQVTQQVGQANINATKLSMLPLPLPPEEELKQLVEFLKRYFAIEKKQNSYLDIEEVIESLTQTILNKAFRGELGTNDLNEESALELLKEIVTGQG